ncbi:MAG: UPF0182 family membrane protein [Chloroflexota bacterium]
MRRNRFALSLLLLALVVLLFWGTGLYTDWLWFDSLGYVSVLQRTLLTQLGLFLAAVLLFLLVFLGNVWLARRLSRRYEPPYNIRGGQIWLDQGQAPGLPEASLTTVLIVVAFFGALLTGLSAFRQWDLVLRYLNAKSFGTQDPLFGIDVGFFVFILPFYRFAVSWSMGAIILALVAVAAVYALRFYGVTLLRAGRLPYALPRALKAHLAILGAVILTLFAISYRLELYELVYSQLGVVLGAGYTDVNVHVPVLNILSIVALVSAALLVVYVFINRIWLPVGGVGLWLAVLLLGNGLYPFFVQKLVVEPSELDHEQTYIQRNIKMTRQAYRLDGITEESYPADATPSRQDVSGNPGTVDNIRLWDHRPLLETYNQIQAIRGYYVFNDVDVDRYLIDGRYRQVMLSARELTVDRLPAEARTWQSIHLQYTHGYGIAMSPVTEISGEGLPQLLVRDVPPAGSLPITRPEIYHGESTAGYIIVNTNIPEFDYPKGDENVYSQYQGAGGVEIGSYVNRVAFAWRFSDGNIILSNFLKGDSRILYHRNIQERIRLLAPYLALDSDPYIVVDEGKLYWIQDAYTKTDKYPYSQLYAKQPLNYISNSVKVVVDAYSGETTFYIADTTDPIVRTYASAFPELFHPLSDIRPGLRAHLRYPEDLFSIQVEMYRTYHMQDPQTFYLREDQWNVPREIYGDKEQPVEPYYVIMRLPGTQQEEFLLMLPTTPPNRQNVIAWMAARSDAEEYGHMLVYKFPKDKLVYGPLQVEGRISQDPTISAQFALWNQAGSRVIRGNMLLIPLGTSNIYVEPIYLQAQNGTLPELKRIVVTAGDRIVMEPTLGAGLARLFDIQVTQPTPAQPSAGQPATTPDAAALARQANDLYDKGQSQIRSGDWAGYGETMKQLKETLGKLLQSTGTR